jgi:hypothetical protein
MGLIHKFFRINPKAIKPSLTDTVLNPRYICKNCGKYRANPLVCKKCGSKEYTTVSKSSPPLFTRTREEIRQSSHEKKLNAITNKQQQQMTNFYNKKLDKIEKTYVTKDTPIHQEIIKKINDIRIEVQKDPYRTDVYIAQTNALYKWMRDHKSEILD